MIQSIADWIVHVVGSTPPWVVYLLVWGIVYSEAAFLVGLILPGETALLAGAVACAIGPTNIGWLIFGACIAAIAGDFTGYQIGLRASHRVTETRIGRWIGQDRWDKAELVVRRGGATAIMTARWIGYVRSLTPFLAGISHMHTRTYLVGNVVGGITYVVTVGIVGYVLGASVGARVLLYGALGVGALALVVFGLRWWVHTTRRRTG